MSAVMLGKVISIIMLIIFYQSEDVLGESILSSIYNVDPTKMTESGRERERAMRLVSGARLTNEP